MKDRVPQHPGRVRLSPVIGQPNVYDMTLEDGATQAGTNLNKANLLDDTTAASLGLTSSDPTVNEALYALSQKVYSEIRVRCDASTTATMAKSGTTMTATANSSGIATFRTNEIGTWTVSGTIFGSSFSKSFVVDKIGILYCYPFTVGGSLEDTAWGDISRISRLGMATDYFRIGDTKTLTIGGATYSAQIIGFDHDTPQSTTTYKRSKAGITFQLVGVHDTTAKMNNSQGNWGSWESSAMRTSTMSTLLTQLPSALTSVLASVNKLTSQGDQYGQSHVTQIITTSDKLFLLSEIEVFGTNSKSYAGEGSQYDWFKAGNSKIKYLNDIVQAWWLRSPASPNYNSFCYVSTSGTSSADPANYSKSVSFAFCV